jgi:hypothetical protein
MKHAQGWRECQELRSNERAFEGFMVGAVFGAIVWAMFGMLMLCLWGVML